MTLEQQVVSLDISKCMKKLGFKQDGVFCWEDDLDAVYLITRIEADNQGEEWSESCPTAYTVAELGEMLPYQIEGNWLWSQKLVPLQNGWVITYASDATFIKQLHYETGNNEADARAKMLIYLAENKLINPSRGV